MRTQSKKGLFLVNKEEFAYILKVLVGIVGLALAAQISIPLKPIPITLHTIAISIIGLTYNPKLSFITILSYVALGAIGFPLYSDFSGGFEVFSGVRFGYFVGFLFATPVIGILNKKLSKNLLGIFLACLAGHLIIYFFGVGWLATIIGFSGAFYSGFVVFIPTGILKLVIFSYLFFYIKCRI